MAHATSVLGTAICFAPIFTTGSFSDENAPAIRAPPVSTRPGGKSSDSGALNRARSTLEMASFTVAGEPRTTIPLSRLSSPSWSAPSTVSTVPARRVASAGRVRTTAAIFSSRPRRQPHRSRIRIFTAGRAGCSATASQGSSYSTPSCKPRRPRGRPMSTVRRRDLRRAAKSSSSHRTSAAMCRR